MAQLEVRVHPAEHGWRAEVAVREGSTQTTHQVTLSPADLERLDPGASDPSGLVRESFVFLLERERKESILRSFALPVIGRYFPEYEREIRRRLGR